MPGTRDQAPGPRSYTLTFTTPGTYNYVCFLHNDIGMNGRTTVLTAGSTPGMPSTGLGSELGPLGYALAGLALVGMGLGLRIRKPRKMGF